MVLENNCVENPYVGIKPNTCAKFLWGYANVGISHRAML